MDIVTLIIQLLSGAVGGNLFGSILKKYSLGLLGNSIAGILGGGIGGQILQSVLGIDAGPIDVTDIGSILTQVAGGGAGGGLLMVIIGIIKSALAK